MFRNFNFSQFVPCKRPFANDIHTVWYRHFRQFVRHKRPFANNRHTVRYRHFRQLVRIKRTVSNRRHTVPNRHFRQLVCMKRTVFNVRHTVRDRQHCQLIFPKRTGCQSSSHCLVLSLPSIRFSQTPLSTNGRHTVWYCHFRQLVFLKRIIANGRHTVRILTDVNRFL